MADISRFSASNIRKKAQETEKQPATGTARFSVNNMHTLAENARQKLLEEEAERKRKVPMLYNEGDALTNPAYVGKGSTWVGAEPFARFNRLNENGAQMAPERYAQIENNLRLKEIDNEINTLKNENAQNVQANYYTPDNSNSAARATMVQNESRIQEMESEKEQREYNRTQLDKAVQQINERSLYSAIQRNGDEGLFDELFTLDYKGKNKEVRMDYKPKDDSYFGRLAQAKEDESKEGREYRIAKILEELGGKGYDAESAYQSYKNERLRLAAEQDRAEYRAFATEHPIAATGIGLAMTPIRGAVSLSGVLADAGQANSPYQGLTRYSEETNETVGQMAQVAGQIVGKRLGLNGSAANALGKFYQMAYNAGTSMVESTIARVTGGKLAEVMLATSAAAQEYDRQLQNGASKGQALASGLTSGIFEALFEHLSLENLRAIKASGTKNVIWNVVKQFFTEGSEEVATDIANEVYDYVANGGLSNYKQRLYDAMAEGKTEQQARREYVWDITKQLGESFAVGGMAGAGGAAWIEGNKAGAQLAAERSVGKAVKTLAGQSEGGLKEVLAPVNSRVLDSASTRTGSGKLGRMVAEETAKAQKAADTALKNTARQANVDTLADAIVESDKKYTKKAAQEIANAYINLITEQNATEYDLETVIENQDAVDKINEVLSGGKYNALAELQKAINDTAQKNKLSTRIFEGLQKWVDKEKLQKAQNTQEIVTDATESLKNGAKNRTESAEKISNKIQPTNVKTAEGRGQISRITNVVDGDIEVQIDESGATEKLSNVDFGADQRTQQTYETLRNMITGKIKNRTPMTVEAANLAIALAQNSSIPQQSFISQFYSAYVAGSVLGNENTMREKMAMDEQMDISPEIIDLAYNAGVTQYEPTPGLTNVSRFQADELQKVELAILNADAQAEGNRVIIFNEMSEYDEGDDSRAIRYKLYGKRSGNDIFVSLNANERRNILTVTGGHESYHWLEATEKQKLTRIINDYLKGRDAKKYKELYDQRARAYRNAGKAFVEEEIAAQYMGTLWADRGLQEHIIKTDKTLAEKILEKFKEFYNRIHERIVEFANKSNDLAMKAALETDDETALKQLEAFEAALKKTADMNRAGAETTEEVQESRADEGLQENEEEIGGGLIYNEDGDFIAPQYSRITWESSDYVQNRDKMIKKIMERVGVDRETAERYVDSINSVSAIIARNMDALDYDQTYDDNTALKKNSEYKYTVDFSTLCAKRLLFTGTFNEIQKAMPNHAFTSEEMLDLRKLMADRGYQVACGICYVESTRRELGPITEQFIERYKIAQKDGTPITRINSKNEVKELKWGKKPIFAEKDYTPTLADLNTTDIDMVRREHPEVYKAYLAYMNARGQNKPKLLETRTAYKGEILRSFNGKRAVKARNDAGGLRIQSFSDFEIVHLIDMMQVVMDMSVVGLKGQAYTKVPAFARAMGNTGMKINLSLIAKGNGVDKNGNLIFDGVEGMDAETAFALRKQFSKNVGTILVGKNDDHIRAALKDPRIDFVIPFHKSQWRNDLMEVLGLRGYEDYTDTQNEKYLLPDGTVDKSRKIKNYDPMTYWKFSKTGEENAKDYLRMCEADGRTPKFPQFKNDEGYWKLLIDFKMYDNDGVGAPQEVVRPEFNDDVTREMLAEYAKTSPGYHHQFPVAKDVVKDFVKQQRGNEMQRQIEGLTGGIKVNERESRAIWDDSKGNGYDGYSMSNNARAAYEAGEKPLSKWTKDAMLNEITALDAEKATMLESVPLRTLKDKLLYKSSWHHTSSMYNRTDFYAIDEDVLENVTQATVNEWMNIPAPQKKETKAFRGAIDYIEWTGTRKRPKANKMHLDNVNIEERGSFYVVTDDSGNEILRKKIGSNGTFVTNYAEQERIARERAETVQRYKENSTPAAYAFYQQIKKNGMDRSTSGNLYARGRKPSRFDYDAGLENFFTEGEQRLYDNTAENRYELETWNGSEWVKEETGTRESRVLNSNAIEYVDRLKGGSRQQWEKLDILQDLAEGLYVIDGPRLGDHVLKQMAEKYILDRKGKDGKATKEQIREFAERLGKADVMLNDSRNVDTVLYGLYRIMRDEVINSGYYTPVEWVQEYRKEFKVQEDGKKSSRMVHVYIPAETRTLLAEAYGGENGLRQALAGRIVPEYSEDAQADYTFDEFYEHLLKNETYEGLPQTDDATEKLNAMLGAYEEDEYLWNSEAEGLTMGGLTADEAATTYAFTILKEIILGGRAFTKEQQAKVDRLQTLEREIMEERREGVLQVITRADAELAARLDQLSKSGMDSIQAEVFRQDLKNMYRLKGIREAYEDKTQKQRKLYNDQVMRMSDEQYRRYKERVVELRREYDEKYERQKERYKEQNKKQREYFEEKREETAKYLRAMYENRRIKQQQGYQDTLMRNSLRNQIKREMKPMVDMFTKDKKGKFIPLAMQEELLDFMQMFSGDRNVITSNAIQALERIAANAVPRGGYDQEAPEGYEYLYGRIDEDVKNELEALHDEISKFEGLAQNNKLYTGQMDVLQLTRLLESIQAIRYIIEVVDELVINGKMESMEAQGRRQVEENERETYRNPVRRLAARVIANNKLMTNMLTPIYFFEEKVGGVMGEMFEDVRAGQDKWAIRNADGKATLRKLKDQYHYDTWANDTKDFVFGDTALREPWKVKLPVEARLQIYATMKREQTNGLESSHLMEGGIVLADNMRVTREVFNRNKLQADIKENGIKAATANLAKATGEKIADVKEKFKGLTEEGVKKSVARLVKEAEAEADSTSKPLSYNELKQIEDSLTKEQKDYADALVKYLSETCSEWGNETSVMLTGLKKFNEKYYFPYQSARDYLHTRIGMSDDTRIKNIGFTKQALHGASNPIIISGFTEVAMNHVEQMARYSSLAVPIDNLNRLWNYKEYNLDAEGKKKESKVNVRTSFKNAYGKTAEKYFITFLQQLNGGIRTDSLDNIWNRGTSMWKRASVMGNMSVVIQQPTALMRAMAMVNPIYFTGGHTTDHKGLKEFFTADYKDMMEHAPVAIVKQMGGFDTMTGKGAAEWMMDDDGTIMDKAADFLGKGAELADAVTWVNIWNAVKRETRAKHKDVDYGSDRFYELAYKRFRDVIDYTQVYDSTISKNAFMRDPGAMTKMVTAFMSEPSLSFNLLTQSGLKKNGRTINKFAAIGAFVANIIINSAFKSFVGAMRDKDEDETYWEKWLKRFFGDVAGDKRVWFLDGAWSPITMIPQIKDFLSIWQGYDVDRSDVSAVADVMEAFKEFFGDENVRDGKFDENDVIAISDLAGVLSNLTPVPIGKIEQDAKSAITMINGWIRNPMHSTFETRRQAILDGLGFDKSNAEKAYEAVLRNNTEYINRHSGKINESKVQDYIDMGYSEENARITAKNDALRSWYNLVKNGILAKDERVVQAADARYNEDFDRYEMLVDEMKEDGLPEIPIIMAVNGLFKDQLPKEENLKEITEKPMYTNDDLKQALRMNSPESFDYLRKELVMSGEKKEDTVNDVAKTYAHEQYLEDVDKKAAKHILTAFAQMTPEEAEEKIGFWDYEITQPDGEMNDSAFKSYWEKVRPSGISVDIYEQYWTAKKNAKGEDANGDGKADSGTVKEELLEIIDSLPITPEQKTALYLTNTSWSENKIPDWNN